MSHGKPSTNGGAAGRCLAGRGETRRAWGARAPFPAKMLCSSWVSPLNTPASTDSLLLNLEGVFTALLAWFVFRENFDRRITVGMVLILVGGIVLSWQGGGGLALPVGSLAVAGACLCWGIDNNLT